MDVGALVCRPHEPRCRECPLRRRCATKGELPHEAERPRQAAFDGSFRQRRGVVLARLRAGQTPVELLDGDALASLVRDGLAAVDVGLARLP
jgi:A/G-specific adenine glycosylase